MHSDNPEISSNRRVEIFHTKGAWLSRCVLSRLRLIRLMVIPMKSVMRAACLPGNDFLSIVSDIFWEASLHARTALKRAIFTRQGPCSSYVSANALNYTARELSRCAADGWREW